MGIALGLFHSLLLVAVVGARLTQARLAPAASRLHSPWGVWAKTLLLPLAGMVGCLGSLELETYSRPMRGPRHAQQWARPITSLQRQRLCTICNLTVRRRRLRAFTLIDTCMRNRRNRRLPPGNVACRRRAAGPSKTDNGRTQWPPSWPAHHQLLQTPAHPPAAIPTGERSDLRGSRLAPPPA